MWRLELIKGNKHIKHCKYFRILVLRSTILNLITFKYGSDDAISNLQFYVNDSFS